MALSSVRSRQPLTLLNIAAFLPTSTVSVPKIPNGQVNPHQTRCLAWCQMGTERESDRASFRRATYGVSSDSALCGSIAALPSSRVGSCCCAVPLSYVRLQHFLFLILILIFDFSSAAQCSAAFIYLTAYGSPPLSIAISISILLLLSPAVMYATPTLPT